MPALTIYVSNSFHNSFMEYELTYLISIQTTPAGPAWTSIILPPTTTSYTTSIILPPSGVPIPMVADTPSEATSAAAAAVTVGSIPSSTDATTVIVETDEAWEAELLEDMKVAVSHTWNGLDMVCANEFLVHQEEAAEGEQEEVRQEEVPALRYDVGCDCLHWRARTGLGRDNGGRSRYLSDLFGGF